MEISCGPFTFTSKFDSGNLARVELVGRGAPDRPDWEFDVWTQPDCAGTEFENNNRTWFYFGVRGTPGAGRLLRLNVRNMNRQTRLYAQGMSPLVSTQPGRPRWERIRLRPSYSVSEGEFVLSFSHRFPALPPSSPTDAATNDTNDTSTATTTYFAFCYPHSYAECQAHMEELEREIRGEEAESRLHVARGPAPQPRPPDDSLFFQRELLCRSLGGLRVDLLTVTSWDGAATHREPRLPHLFPRLHEERPPAFPNKKVFVVTARSHPGESPGSFVLSGFVRFITRRGDPRAAELRRRFLFKVVPMLNPDGVRHGHYRTDTRGVNLNRVYGDPCPLLHPSVYAVRSLVLYHHRHNNRNDPDNRSDRATTPLRSRPDYPVDRTPERITTEPATDARSAAGRSPVNRSMSQPTAKPLAQMAAKPNARSPIARSASQPTARSPTARSPTARSLTARLPGQSAARLTSRSTGQSTARSLAARSPAARPLDRTTAGPTARSTAQPTANPAARATAQSPSARPLAIRLPSQSTARSPGRPTAGPTARATAESVTRTTARSPSARPLARSVSPVDPALNHNSNHRNHLNHSAVKRSLSDSDCAVARSVNHGGCGGGVSGGAGGGCGVAVRTGSEEVTTREVETEEVVERGALKTLKTNEVEELAEEVDGASGVAYYIDLHGHATRRGCFLYGNALDDEGRQVENVLFAKLMELNSAHFELGACNFSAGNMRALDRSGGQSKAGSGRVALHNATGITHSYTLECNYNTGRRVGHVAPFAHGCGVGDASSPPSPPAGGGGPPPFYTPAIFEQVGEALAVSALDQAGANPWPRTSLADSGGLQGLRSWVRHRLRSARTAAGNSSGAKLKAGTLTTSVSDSKLSLHSHSNHNSNHKNGDGSCASNWPQRSTRASGGPPRRPSFAGGWCGTTDSDAVQRNREPPASSEKREEAAALGPPKNNPKAPHDNHPADLRHTPGTLILTHLPHHNRTHTHPHHNHTHPHTHPHTQPPCRTHLTLSCPSVMLTLGAESPPACVGVRHHVRPSPAVAHRRRPAGLAPLLDGSPSGTGRVSGPRRDPGGGRHSPRW